MTPVADLDHDGRLDQLVQGRGTGDVAPALISRLAPSTGRDTSSLAPFFKPDSWFAVRLEPRISARVCQVDPSALILHCTMIKRPRI